MAFSMSSQGASKPPPKRAGRSRLARFLLASLLVLGATGLGGVGAIYWLFLRDLPDLRSAQDYHPALASVVLDRSGHPIGEFFRERRQLTPFEEIPRHVVMAFVAGEDGTFFDHAGIDFQSILRAAWVNLRAGGEIKQGGSTITQQMVKTLFLSPEKKFRRKIREMILARDIEQRLSKQEILHLYLNQIYFGHGAYGIGEAARTYFGKQVSELGVSEGALLAGLPKAPSRYSPFRNPDESERRRRYVLERMHEDRILDADAHAAALAERPVLTDAPWRRDFEAAAYFTEEVRRHLFDTLGGETVLEGGLRIETTLDLELQKAAVGAVQQGLMELDRRQGYRGFERRVADSEIPAELERLAVENDLPESAGDAGAGVGEAEAAEPVDAAELAAAGDEAALPETGVLPEDGPLWGVVTEVVPDAQIAWVGFAPGVDAVVRLADVSWARKADPDVRPRPVKQIEEIFRVGDVGRFELLPVSAEPPPEDSPAHGARLARLVQDPIVEGAVFSMEVETGAVLALVGGYDDARSQFDRVTQARRQAGSSFKPFVYGAAISSGEWTPASIVHDTAKVHFDESSGFLWRPRNYGRKFYGAITLRKSLAKSVNNATLHLASQVGLRDVVAYARRVGIRSPMDEQDLSLALGTTGVSLLEMTRAYAVFPSGGRLVTPIFITRVLDREGNVLMENVPLGDPLADETPEEPDAPPEEPTLVRASAVPHADDSVAPGDAPGGDDTESIERDPSQALDPGEAFLVTDMLRAVVDEGTGWRLRALKRPLGGKTGTTNDQADAWFIGFSPGIATGVWVGHDESRFLGWGETGSRAAAPIWVETMRAALAGRPARDFAVPESIVWARIDRDTGLLATRATENSVFQAFLAGTEPTRSAEGHRTDTDARDDLRRDTFSSSARHLMRMDSF